MKLARFEAQGRISVGRVEADMVVEFVPDGADSPVDIRGILSKGGDYVAALAARELAGAPRHRLTDVRLLAPIPDPTKFMAIGLNYESHAQEAREHNIPVLDYQVWFNKQVSCISGPVDPVVYPRVTERLDYEAELAVVIGKRCRHVSVADAMSVVAGYMVTNDFTARDWQFRTPTWTLGKSFDTHGPTGPWLTTADEIADPQALPIRLFVNGEIRQSSSTAEMIYRIADQIAYLTTVMTLEPGDIIATGTPAGVAIAMKPPRFLNVGDVVRTEIEGLGHMENIVVAED